MASLNIFVFSKETHCGPRLKRKKGRTVKCLRIILYYSAESTSLPDKKSNISGLHKSGARYCEYSKEWFFNPNELNSPIAANFCPTIFFGLDFHFYVIFLLIGIGQLDNDILKKCPSKNFNSFSLTKSTTEFECELRYCDEVYLYIPNLLQG